MPVRPLSELDLRLDKYRRYCHVLALQYAKRKGRVLVDDVAAAAWNGAWEVLRAGLGTSEHHERRLVARAAKCRIADWYRGEIGRAKNGQRPVGRRAAYGDVTVAWNDARAVDNGSAMTRLTPQDRLEFAFHPRVVDRPPATTADDLRALGLSARNARIVAAYFFAGRTMRDIADEFGLSESRVSLIVAESLTHCRAVGFDKVAAVLGV